MNIKNKISLIIPILFSVITLVITLNRTPFWDETHAFEIARLNFFEILYLTRIEGHNILWFLILKPFSALKFYPYSMLIINWLFASCSIFVLWKKAPFNDITKILITFSTPFLLYFAPVARCYAIGVLFLFLICANFKYRYKKPYLFSILLLVCSNTSLMTLIPCFYLWIMYLFQLTKKNSKKTIICLSFFILNIILLLIQFLGVKQPYNTQSDHNNFVYLLNSFIVFPKSDYFYTTIFHILVFILFYYSIFYLYKKSKYALFLMIGSFFTLTYIFYFIYGASFWNHYFYYIYFVVLYWLFYRQTSKNKFLRYLCFSIFLCCCFPCFLHKNGEIPMTYSSNSKKIAEIVFNNIDRKNAEFYCLDWWSDISPASDLYFKKKGITIYDVFHNDRTGFKSISSIFYYRIMPLDIEKFYNSLDKTKKNYIITDGTFFKMDKTNSKSNYYFKYHLLKNELKFGVFEIVKK